MMAARSTLKRSLDDLDRRLQPTRPKPGMDEPSGFGWLSDDELERCEHLLELIDDLGEDDPEAMVAHAEFLHLIAQGEARRARGEATVIERHLARWAG
jgi:hypothetical protein